MDGLRGRISSLHITVGVVSCVLVLSVDRESNQDDSVSGGTSFHQTPHMRRLYHCVCTCEGLSSGIAKDARLMNTKYEAPLAAL